MAWLVAAYALTMLPLAFWWCCCSPCRCCTSGSAPDSYQISFSGFTGVGQGINGKSILCHYDYSSTSVCAWAGVFPGYIDPPSTPQWIGTGGGSNWSILQVCGYVIGNVGGFANLDIHYDDGSPGGLQFGHLAGTVGSLATKRNCRTTYSVSVTLPFQGWMAYPPGNDTGTATVTPV